MARRKKDDVVVETVFPENGQGESQGESQGDESPVETQMDGGPTSETLMSESPMNEVSSFEDRFHDQPFQMVELSLIDPNPYQPRAQVQDSDVTDLARGLSIKRERLPDTCGLLQIPVARYHVGRFQLAFGHRRYQAFSLNHHNVQRKVLDGDWSRMPLRVVQLSDEEMYDFAARENGDRVQLNDIERARSIQLAQDEFGWSLTEAANAHGLSKSAGSNLVRLLQLPDGVQGFVAGGQLGQRHARALLPLIQREETLTETCLQVAREAAGSEWPVTRLEEWVTVHLRQLEYERLRAARREELAAKRETRYCYFCLKPQELTGLELAGNERVSCGHCGKTMTASIWRLEPQPVALLKSAPDEPGTSSGDAGTGSEGAGTSSQGSHEARIAALTCPECGERQMVERGLGTVHCPVCDEAWSSVEAVLDAGGQGSGGAGEQGEEEIPERSFGGWASERPAPGVEAEEQGGGGAGVSGVPVSGVTLVLAAEAGPPVEVEQGREPGEFDCPRCGEERVVRTNGGAWCLNCEAEWTTVADFRASLKVVKTQAHGFQDYREQLLAMESKLHERLRDLIGSVSGDHLGHIEDWLESVGALIDGAMVELG